MGNGITIAKDEVVYNLNLGSEYEYSYADIAGSVYGGIIASDGSAYVLDGGLADGFSIFGDEESPTNRGLVYIRAGGLGTNITVNAYSDYVVYGESTGAILNADGIQKLESGSLDTDAQIMGGEQRIASGACAQGACMTAGHQSIYSGGAAKNTTISDGTQQILGNGLSSGSTLTGGILEIYYGGTAQDLTLGQNAYLKIYGSGNTLSGYCQLSGHVNIFGSLDVSQADIVYSIKDNTPQTSSVAWQNYFDDFLNARSLSFGIGKNQSAGTYLLLKDASTLSTSLNLTTIGIDDGESMVLGETWYGFTRSAIAKMVDDDLVLEVLDEALHPAWNHTGSALHWTTDPIEEHSYSITISSVGQTWNFSSTAGEADILNLPTGHYICEVDGKQGNEIDRENTETSTARLEAVANGCDDIFFASTKGIWQYGYYAQNLGDGEAWMGTNEKVSLGGRNRIALTFAGSEDRSRLFLTDDANGDALLLDDIYTAISEDSDVHNRLAAINEIYAGAGDDIVDLTSNDGDLGSGCVTVYGGDGNDIIWGGSGSYELFGEDGDDILVGGAGNDLFVGGAGLDSFVGGGGNDTFFFASDWCDCESITQTDTGTVTLWFQEAGGSWDPNTRTYTWNNAKVTVSGACQVNIITGENDSPELFGRICTSQDVL